MYVSKKRISESQLTDISYILYIVPEKGRNEVSVKNRWYNKITVSVGTGIWGERERRSSCSLF